MRRRVAAMIALAGGIAAIASWPVSGQGAGAPPLVITAYNGGAAIPYTVPRTPWGDPDLQGVWSSDDTEGIPRERPANLGTRLYQNDQEYAARTKQRLWQESFYDHVVRPEEDLSAIARYIIDNPVRAGIVKSPLDYPFAGSDMWPVEEILRGGPVMAVMPGPRE